VAAAAITWIVLARDVPATIHVRGADRLAAVMVLDADTWLVRGIAVENGTEAALRQAVATALTQPAAELPAGTPGQVLCAIGLAEQVRGALAAAAPADRSVVVEVQPGPEAEDIFDSFLGHMAGRTQPDEFPTPADWQVLIEQAAAFRDAESWTRWSDEQDLAVEVRLPDGVAAYTAVVMGQAGIQHGLALYPGDQLPPGLRESGPAELAPSPPTGTLLLSLDPPEQVPVELVAKAIRYGWPAEDDLVPMFLAFTATGAAEIGREDAQRLSAGVAAVLALDRRGPRPVENASKPITGTILLGDHQPARFTVRHRPYHDEPPQYALRLHHAGHDLLPPDTPVTLGHLAWAALPELRAAARVHRPAPADAPAPAGREVPLLVLCPDPRLGPSLAARIASLDPYGVSAVDTGNGHEVLVLAGGEAAEALLSLPADHPALAAFHRRYRQTRGRHVIMVAGPSSATGEGAVYGLFECHQPPPPRQPKKKPTQGRKR
jgi:hypothetical protein